MNRLTTLRHGLTISLLVSLVLVASPARAAQLFGFNDNNFAFPTTPSGATVAGLEAKVGAQVQRIPVSWDRIEPGTCQKSATDWSFYDTEVAALRAKNIRPVLLLWDAPQWAWGEGTCGASGAEPACGVSTTCHVPPGDRYLPAWASIAGQLATRYRDAAAIEIWNEPNERGWWQVTGGPDPARYERVFAAAAGAIHAANTANGTRIPVLTGGLAWFGSDAPGDHQTIMTFMRGFALAGGSAALLGAADDAIGVHAYPLGLDPGTGGQSCLVSSPPLLACGTALTPNTSFNRTLKEYRDVRNLFFPAKRFWLTETGVGSIGQGMTEAKQAETLVNLRHYVATMGDVNSMIIQSLVEPDYGTAEERSYGIVRQTLAPKPAFCALAQDARLAKPDGC